MARLPNLFGGDKPAATRKVLLSIIDLAITNARERIRVAQQGFTNRYFQEALLLEECSETTGTLSQSIADVRSKVGDAELVVQACKRSVCESPRQELVNLKMLRDFIGRGKYDEASRMLEERRCELVRQIYLPPVDASWNILCNVYGPDGARTQLSLELGGVEFCIHALSVIKK
jgi:hypothetical protein